MNLVNWHWKERAIYEGKHNTNDTHTFGDGLRYVFESKIFGLPSIPTKHGKWWEQMWK